MVPVFPQSFQLQAQLQLVSLGSRSMSVVGRVREVLCAETSVLLQSERLGCHHSLRILLCSNDTTVAGIPAGCHVTPVLSTLCSSG
jgi:hypothetical protein